MTEGKKVFHHFLVGGHASHHVKLEKGQEFHWKGAPLHGIPQKDYPRGRGIFGLEWNIQLLSQQKKIQFR